MGQQPGMTQRSCNYSGGPGSPRPFFIRTRRPYWPALTSAYETVNTGLYMWGERAMFKSCPLLTAAALSSHGDVIRIVFSPPMSPSLVGWVSPTAVRVPQGERVRWRQRKLLKIYHGVFLGRYERVKTMAFFLVDTKGLKPWHFFCRYEKVKPWRFFW